MSDRKITVLGSAAAEAIPAIFCVCDTCRQAWANGGKDMRLRTSYQLGEFVRIDFGPDAMAQEYRYGLHSEKLRHIIVTHSHADHFDPALFFYRKATSASMVDPENTLHIYGGTGVMRKLYQQVWNWGKTVGFRGDLSCLKMMAHELKAFEPVELPDVDMTIYPLKADHMVQISTEEPFIYIIRWEDKYMMIANDTGYFCDENWEYLAKMNIKLSLVFNDCTGCGCDKDRNHMGGKFVIDTRTHLAELGLIDENTRYFVNHFSHNGHMTHAQLEEYFNPHNIGVGFDGLEINL